MLFTNGNTVVQWLSLTLHSQKVQLDLAGSFSVEFARSPCVCLGLTQVLWSPNAAIKTGFNWVCHIMDYHYYSTWVAPIHLSHTISVLKRRHTQMVFVFFWFSSLTDEKEIKAIIL